MFGGIYHQTGVADLRWSTLDEMRGVGQGLAITLGDT